jgi:glycosyltransferase involved in cell wall biosynthesis
MWKYYRWEQKRFQLLSCYKAIVTLSSAVRAEFLRHGLAPERVEWIPFGFSPEHLQPPAVKTGVSTTWRLLFLGRTEFLKGGHVLLEALPKVRRVLNRPLRVTFAGDGPERQAWTVLATRLKAQDSLLAIEFVGWMNHAQKKQLWAETDLLVVPSLWPEPFGLVGPEAGLHGIPAAAFAVGGIPDWLKEGINGHLAPATPPTGDGLAEAICRCLRDATTYARLSRGAVESARHFTLSNHMAALMDLFKKIARH